MKHILVHTLQESDSFAIYFDGSGSDEDGEGTEARPYLTEDRATRELTARVLKEPYRSNWAARVVG